MVFRGHFAMGGTCGVRTRLVFPANADDFAAWAVRQGIAGRLDIAADQQSESVEKREEGLAVGQNPCKFDRLKTQFS